MSEEDEKSIGAICMDCGAQLPPDIEPPGHPERCYDCELRQMEELIGIETEPKEDSNGTV